jgi:hypothetical protein
MTARMTGVRIAMNAQTSDAVETRREQTPQTGEPECSHIVKTDGDDSAAAKVLRARIEGTPLEALCGHRWIPSRDPKQLPLCATCKDIYDTYRAFNDGLHETPSE